MSLRVERIAFDASVKITAFVVHSVEGGVPLRSHNGVNEFALKHVLLFTVYGVDALFQRLFVLVVRQAG